MKRTDLLEKIFSNVNYWLAFAEAKHAMNIAGVIAILSFVVDLNKCNKLYILICVFLLISALLSFLSFFPTISKKFKWKMKNNCGSNLLFYEDIKEYTVDDYLNAINDSIKFDEKETRIDVDYSNEIIVNSKITSRKYKLFKCAIFFDILSFFLLVMYMIDSLFNRF